MRKILLIVVASAFSKAYAQPVTLSGELPALSAKSIVVKAYDHFKGDIPVNEEGVFSADLLVDKGYYFLENAAISVYLEPGMNLVVTKPGKDPVFTGKGSRENNLLVRLSQTAEQYLPVKAGRLTEAANFIEPDDFLRKVADYKAVALKLVGTSGTSSYFKTSQAVNIEYTGQSFVRSYLEVYGIDPRLQREMFLRLNEYRKSYQLKAADAPELLEKYRSAVKAMHLKTLSAADSSKLNSFARFDPNNELAYISSEAYRAMHEQYRLNLFNVETARQYAAGGTTADKARDRYYGVTNNFIKQNIDYQRMISSIKSNTDNKEKSYEAYFRSAASPEYVQDIKRLYFGTKKLDGSVSPDFIFSDVNDSKVSLSSFKGKYVYIDIWSTWCIPCIAQIPAMKELEKKYHGKNIAFISISRDDKKDIPAWKKFVADNKMTGTQLNYPGREHPFLLFYRVQTIPRFILIDPSGKVISEEALKPSDPALQVQLDQFVGNK